MHGHLNVKIICIFYFLFTQGQFLITGDQRISLKIIAYETLGILLFFQRFYVTISMTDLSLKVKIVHSLYPSS